MTDLKLEILEILSEDARTSHDQIALMVGESVEKVEQAIRELENDLVIASYGAHINHSKCDDEQVEALIEVRVTPQRDRGFATIARRIYQFDEVRSVYLMSGGFDLMVLVDGISMREVAFFVAEKLSTIDGVLSTATHFVLKKYKDNGIVFDDETDERLVVSP